ncbi:MAG: hypothetical protein IT430_00385 [Phycisphaerales bacterium]|nr:hypothetical protein [Phycisphaerales bacterium]
MNKHVKGSILVCSAMAAMGHVAIAGEGPGDADARVAALESQRDQLDAQINAMKQGDRGAWLSGARAEEVRALVREVMAESETRSSLLAEGMNAGWDKGFFLKNDDGTFSLKIKGQTQFRYVWNSKDSPDTDVASFEMRRAKLEFSGNIYSKDLKYKIKGAFERNGGAFVLEDAYGEYILGNGWSFKWGQYKPAFMTEETISSSKQLAVDRSVVNEITNLGFSQGVELNYESENIAFAAGFTDGATLSATGAAGNRANTNFSNDTTEWALNARIDGLLAGTWKQFEDFTSWSSDETGFKIGAGLFWQDGEYGTGAPDEVQWLQWTVDAQAEFGGANIFGSVVGRHSDANMTTTTDVDQYGFVVQGGYHIVPDKFEIFGRYEWFDFDGAFADDYNAVTIGFNYYFHKHDWKWTTDLVWNLDRVPFSVSGVGLLSDGATDEDQVALRTQVQMLF